MRRIALAVVVLLCASAVSAEQFKPPKSSAPARATAAATPKPAGKKTAAKPKPKGPPAKMLFGAVDTPAPLAARAIGSYAKGCLAGGVSLPINGPEWQVMRLSRNRNWGTPRLLDYLEKLAKDAKAKDGWPGLLVGDMSQPRGGPMITGHTSHQVGLDVDIWLTPMPDRVLTPEEREDMTAKSMLKDPFNVDPNLFTEMQVKLIRRAASYPQVTRIFVHPAIKKALCEQAGKDRAWLGKVRPWWNHYYHFHVRLACPPDMESCGNQPPTKGDDGCGQELAEWYKMLRQSEIASARPAVPVAPGTPPPPKKAPLGLADLPAECKTVLSAGDGGPKIAEDGTVPAALAREASKDAGEPLPHFDAATVEALKAQIAAAKGKKGVKETAVTIAAVATAAPAAVTTAATPAAATPAAATPAGATAAAATPAAVTPAGAAMVAPSDVPIYVELPIAQPAADIPLPDRKPSP